MYQVAPSKPAWLAILLVFAFALSGCLGGGDDDLDGGNNEVENGNGEATNGDGDGSSEESSNGTTDPAPVLPPTATLVANLTAGEVPLNVTFTLDGADPQDLPITWTLDVDDGSATYTGDALPTDVEHSFTEAGNFTVTFTVSNGEHATAETVILALTEAMAPELVGDFLETAQFLAGITDGPAIVALLCPGFLVGENGLGCVFFELSDDHPGLMFELESTDGPLRLAYWSACSPTANAMTTASSDSESFLTDEIPDGAGCMIVWAAASHSQNAPIDYALRIYAS